MKISNKSILLFLAIIVSNAILAKVIPGPLANLKKGLNSVSWTYDDH